MSSPDLSQVIFADKFAGLGENESAAFSVEIPSQSLAANAGKLFTASISMQNSGSIPHIKYRLTGLESEWRILQGMGYYAPGSFAYQITTRSYFDAGTLYVKSFILELLGSGTTIPAMTIDCKASLYDAPF